MIEFYNEDCSCDFLSKIKSATIVEEPWRYLVMDDMLCQSCFDKVMIEVNKGLKYDYLDLNLDHETKLVKKTHHPNHRPSEIFGHEDAPREEITKFRSDQHSQQLLNSLEYVYGLYPNYRKYDSVFVYPSIAQIKNGLSWHVHDDEVTKNCTLIIYLDPKESTGTTIYSTETDYHHTIEWKPNRATLFCPQQGVTWHAYRSSSETRTSMSFFATKNPLHNQEELYAKYGNGNGSSHWGIVFDYISTKKCVKYFN